MSARYDPESEGIVYWVAPEADAETAYYSDDDSDTGDSDVSADTLMSSEIPDYFQEIGGRMFVNNPNVPIWYPVDEHRKLELQHKLFRLVYGGNHFGPVAGVLQYRSAQRPRVLDLGTRDGSWVQEMASEFPHVQFLSLDVAPIVRHTPRENVAFEVYDISEGILEEDESFDFVRIVHPTEITKDVPGLLKETQRLLKPGGLLLVIEPEMMLYESQHITQQSVESTPHTWKLLDTLHRALALQEVEVNAYQLLGEWLSPGSDLWSHADPESFLPFASIDVGTQTIHAGGWDSDIRRQEIRLILAQLGTTYARNMAVVISMLEPCPDIAQGLIDDAVKELKDPCTSYAFKLHHVFARKSCPRTRDNC